MDPTPFLGAIVPAPYAVLERAARDPDRPRFRVRAGSAWTPVSWGRFAEEVRAVAGWLIDRGFAPGDVAAVYATNSVAWAATALGIQAAGGVMVPIYPASTAEQAVPVPSAKL